MAASSVLDPRHPMLSQVDKSIYPHVDQPPKRQAAIQTGRQTVRQTDRQTDRPTDKGKLTICNTQVILTMSLKTQ